jgi:primosomal protein N' (replication factor Y)
MKEKNFDQVEVLGPRPALVEKRSNKFTFSILFKSSNINQLHNIVKSMTSNYQGQSSISIRIDVDPYNIY